MQPWLICRDLRVSKFSVVKEGLKLCSFEGLLHHLFFSSTWLGSILTFLHIWPEIRTNQSTESSELKVYRRIHAILIGV